MFLSCAGNKATEGESMNDADSIFCFKDSCDHLAMSISLQLPMGTDSISMQICDSLVAEFIRSISNSEYSGEADSIIPPCEYKRDDIQSLVDYYGHATYQRLLKMAMSDYNDRMSYLNEDTTMSAEEREQIKADIPQWTFDLAIKKAIDAPSFVIYNSQTYCYYGGAHGGVIGTGPITFSKANGSKIEHFLRDDAALALQPLIRNGLLQYYSESGDTITDSQLSERLQIEGSVIPLPHHAPYLNATADSLVFTYAQYEIAAYADGMPSFILPVKALSDFLTPELRTLLGNSRAVTKEQ